MSVESQPLKSTSYSPGVQVSCAVSVQVAAIGQRGQAWVSGLDPGVHDVARVLLGRAVRLGLSLSAAPVLGVMAAATAARIALAETGDSEALATTLKQARALLDSLERDVSPPAATTAGSSCARCSKGGEGVPGGSAPGAS